jgi:hypothetical protein
MLSPLRLWDGKRLTHTMGQLPDDQFESEKQALRSKPRQNPIYKNGE